MNITTTADPNDKKRVQEILTLVIEEANALGKTGVKLDAMSLHLTDEDRTILDRTASMPADLDPALPVRYWNFPVVFGAARTGIEKA